MARLTGVERGGSLLSRVLFFLTRKKLGRVPRPMRIHALVPRLLSRVARMDLVQEEPRHLPRSLVKLGQVRVAMRVGCPF